MNLELINGVFFKNNLPRIKDRTYEINLYDKNSKGTHWFSLFIDRIIVVYFDYFGIEFWKYILEVLSKFKDKSINHNIFRISLLYCFHRVFAYRKNFLRLY